MNAQPESSVLHRYPIGESCLCWSLGNRIDPMVSRRVLAAFKTLRDLQAGGKFNALDVVPSYQALAVYFDPLAINPSELQQTVETAIRSAMTGTPPEPAGREIILPTDYSGPDLDRVAAHASLSRDEVISLHAGARYTVAMIGFLPHFPYLIGLPDKLSTPRLDSPRLRVPAGSVTITGTQTGVYPGESPGGWNIIGSTDPALLPALEPGDTVIFQIK